jgi:hypothetical protein
MRGVDFFLPHLSHFRRWRIAANQTFVLISISRFKQGARSKMRMNLRTEECRRHAAECAQRALCASDQDARRTFAELAEQWRMLAEHTEYLGRYN